MTRVYHFRSATQLSAQLHSDPVPQLPLKAVAKHVDNLGTHTGLFAQPCNAFAARYGEDRRVRQLVAGKPCGRSNLCNNRAHFAH
jgi:hypothetical protein